MAFVVCTHTRRYAGEAFVVSHFAGEVEYSVRSFLEKNRDTINESLKTILTRFCPSPPIPVPPLSSPLSSHMLLPTELDG